MVRSRSSYWAPREWLMGVADEYPPREAAQDHSGAIESYDAARTGAVTFATPSPHVDSAHASSARSNSAARERMAGHGPSLVERGDQEVSRGGNRRRKR